MVNRKVRLPSAIGGPPGFGPSPAPSVRLDDVTSGVLLSTHDPMVLAEATVRASTADRILDAAFESFRDFGLSRITMEDVASRAGLSRQSVYRYFPSKDSLIVALVSREEEKFLD